MGVLRAVVRAIWGTDAKCEHERERAESDRMIKDAEQKVARLQSVLSGSAPPRSLDEALYELTHKGRG